MTNEELAALAAQGDKEALHKLYLGVAPLLFKLISHYFPLCMTNGMIAPEDLLQCGYFATIAAVKWFKPEKEIPFIYYLKFPVATACLNELGIRQKHRVPKRPLSLDEPVSEGSTVKLGDNIKDPHSDIYENSELNDMQLIVRDEIEKLTPRDRYIIYGVYFEGKPLHEVAHELGLDYGYSKFVKREAFEHLRQSKAIQMLKDVYVFRDNQSPEGYLCFGDDDLELL